MPKLVSSAPFDPAIVLPEVAEFEAVEARYPSIFKPHNLDGLIGFLSTIRASANREFLIQGYHRLLDDLLAPPSGRPRVDFNKLPRGARPYLLAPYIDCRHGQLFPRLCLTSSNFEGGRLMYISAGGPVEPAIWRQSLNRISDWLGDRWVIERVSADTLTLIRQRALPSLVTFNADMLNPGHLFIGLDRETHRPLHLPFAQMSSGTLVAGASGTGKSSAIHLLLRSLFSNLSLFSAIYLVDGKDGVAFNRYAGFDPKVHVLWEDAALYQLATDLVATMARRNTHQRELGIDNAEGDYIALVIDEMATFTAKPSLDPKSPASKAHTVFIDDLSRLAMRGRSTGLRMIISAQSPVAEQVPVSVRANCQTTIAFRLPVDAHASALFGQLDNLPADPRKLPCGCALIANGTTGELHQVQFPLAPLFQPSKSAC